jgi:SAM-dependent methyltransferase
MLNPDADADYIQWKRWSAEAGFGALQQEERRYFGKEVSAARGESILHVMEVGFGSGAFLAFCREQGWSVTGIEQNRLLVEAARGAGFQAFENDLVPRGVDGFDLIAAFDVLEHIPAELAERWIGDLHDRLAPGGTLLLRFPNGDSPFGMTYQNGDPTHVSVVGSLKARYYAEKAGFSDVVTRSQRRLILSRSPARLIQRLAAALLSGIVEAAAIILYPHYRDSSFTSDNLILVARRSSAKNHSDRTLR